MSKTFKVIGIIVALLLVSLIIWIKKLRQPNAEDKLSSLPFLKEDTLNVFKTGDHFIILKTWNSCCMGCYVLRDSSMTDELPPSAIYKWVETIEDPANPDCAGCTDYYYYIMECIAHGTDTLTTVSIPMGSVNVGGCQNQNKEILKDEVLIRKYFILCE